MASSAARSVAQAESLFAQLPLPLGESLPPRDAHALSVNMPTWEDTVGYEEARPAVLEAMACGYPRFFRHPLVRALEAHLRAHFAPFQQLPAREGTEWDLMALPTEPSARRLVAFLSTQADAVPADTQRVAAHSVRDGLVWAVVFPKTLTPTANRFWQHTGEIISSRHAERVLDILTAGDNSEDAKQQLARPVLHGSSAHEALRKRIAGLYFGADHADETARNVFNYPTGMGAIFAALRLLTHFNPDAKAILFGFPYLDTLKLLQRTQWCPAGVHFFPVSGEKELAQVEAILKTEKIVAIFTEFPGNPLLSTPDLERLAALAHAHGTFLAVDDTVGSYNINPMKFGSADIVLTSLAKIFSGTCNVMSGSLVLNPQGAAYGKFLEHLTSTQDSFLVDSDAQVLCEASADLEERLTRVNASASLIAERLQKHALVKSLFYPQLNEDVERFHRFASIEDKESEPRAPRYGPLLSIVLHGGASVARAFFDNLKVAKGPSLGTNFTLACPYTILAHYYELDYVETCGVDRHLVRISIGLEDPEAIWSVLQDALGHAESAFQQL